MDGDRFDKLSRKLADGVSRRRALTGVAGGLLVALGARGSTLAQQVTQAYCGNQTCTGDACTCKPGCECCKYTNGNSRCLAPGLCRGGTVQTCGGTGQPCNEATESGGQGTTTTIHELGTAGPTSFQLTYQMYTQQDQLEVFYESALIYTTGGLVSGGQTVTVNVPAGTSQQVTVVVSAPESGTIWDYTVFCPATPV
jgi:hypothetical protein